MCMLTRRLHVLLDEEQYQRVAHQATSRGVSVATVVREAIDRGLTTTTNDRRRAAGRRLLAAEPMDVPDRVEDLRTELDEARDRWT